MIVLRELARAKLNLFLHVTGKRADGCHLLQSLVAFADTGDTVQVAIARDLTLRVEGPYARSLPADNNSVLKAAQALQRHCKEKVGAAITLHKSLPVSSGIGGGSADAAAALRLLMRLWKMEISAQELEKIAISLGADVPACLLSSALLMSGIGEIITPVALPRLYAVLVNPGTPLPTASVFSAFSGRFTPAQNTPAFPSAASCAQFLRIARNDLEPAAVKLLPEIREVIATLEAEKECLLARMSGSGATCFGLFATENRALAAVQGLHKQHPGWWVKKAVLQ